jgi:nickel/cobalt exporter
MLLGPAVLLPALILPAGPAAAHSLDAYLQATYLTLAPSTITVELDLSPGVLIAPRVLSILDGDGDHQVTDAEARTYLGPVLAETDLRVDDQPLSLTLTSVDVPAYRTIQAGYATLRLFATTTTAPAAEGSHRVFFRNGFSDANASYQINAFVADGAAVVLGAQQRDATQRQTTVSYQVGAAAAGQPAGDQARAETPVGAGRLAGYLEDPSLSVWVVLLALGSAALLGALHALTPGHAKTLMAAYLIGSGGTTANAVTLGAVVTFTHTASVILIGLIALLASQFLVPAVLVPILEGVAGLLVLGLGLRLLRQRRPSRKRPSPASSRTLVPSGAPHRHDHAHSGHGHDATGHGAHPFQHDHDPHHHDPHSHHPHPHQHGGRAHTHDLPPGGITTRNLIIMGISGGLVPCPEALGVMILAVGVNRTILGLGLIVSFSLGLAAVLIGIGVLLLRSRTLIDRLDRIPASWATFLPLISAVVVTVLGLGLVLKALGAGLLPW